MEPTKPSRDLIGILVLVILVLVLALGITLYRCYSSSETKPPLNKFEVGQCLLTRDFMFVQVSNYSIFTDQYELRHQEVVNMGNIQWKLQYDPNSQNRERDREFVESVYVPIPCSSY